MKTTRIAFILLFMGTMTPTQGLSTSPERATESVLLFAGQSREEFREYLKDVSHDGRATPRPVGATLYTSLLLTGLESAHENIPGDHAQDLPFLLEQPEPLMLQIGLWLGADQLKGIINGDFDPNIYRLGKRLGQTKRPVFLRIGYEFDGPHNQYLPDLYQMAYRRIGREMRKHGNIILVWHSFALLDTFQGHDVMQWYPGDKWVDWLAVSFFQVTDDGYFRAPNRQRLVDIAREKGKPLMIAEASPIRYTARQKQLSGDEWWDDWFNPLFKFIEETPEVRALCIINVNWNSQKQHRVLNWEDARLNQDPVILQRWQEKMKKAYWVRPSKTVYTRPWKRSKGHEEEKRTQQ